MRDPLIHDMQQHLTDAKKTIISSPIKTSTTQSMKTAKREEVFNQERVNKNLAIIDIPVGVEEQVWCGNSVSPNTVLHISYL